MSQPAAHRWCFWVVASLSLASVAVADVIYLDVLWGDRRPLLEFVLLVLMSALFLWIAASFWMATLGFAALLFRRPRPHAAQPEGAPSASLPRTAILMPIHNEDPASVFAGLGAVCDSLRQTGLSRAFDVFVLSDTTDPEIWLKEELAWAELKAELGDDIALFYRRRRRRAGHKAGNIADFCTRWGAAYTYMIILDADTVMAGPTLLEMVRRMEADPRLGILQVPPRAVDGDSLFARVQQFAAGVYGPIWARGYALCSHDAGNYWGHSAIVRVAPFLAHCGLPRLPGQPPFGGELLSHDFVEAALMYRAGWKIRIADDLAGSYEQCPADLVAFARRDQRWCQGNLQHLRLLVSAGFRPASRVHFTTGVMYYLSSPVWLLWMLLGVLETATRGPRPAGTTQLFPNEALWLFGAAMLLLLLPKLWGLLWLVFDRQRLRGYGGVIRTAAGLLFETVISVLAAPILMAFHTIFVAATFCGRRVRWTAQRRCGRALTLREALDAHAGQTLSAAPAGLLLIALTPGLFWWFAPVLAGLAASIPLSLALSSGTVGRACRRRGLLLTPEEADPPFVLQRCRERLARMRARACRVHPFVRVILDARFNSLHVAMLNASRRSRPAAAPGWPAVPTSGRMRLGALKRVALYGGPRQLTRQQRLALLSSPEALRWLHLAAWSTWPATQLQRFSRQCATAL